MHEVGKKITQHSTSLL